MTTPLALVHRYHVARARAMDALAFEQAKAVLACYRLRVPPGRARLMRALTEADRRVLTLYRALRAAHDA